MGYLLDHLLSESAQRMATAEALSFEQESLDYGRLEQRSNRAARALREEGVRPGDRVGLHMRKTADAIVALFAILKAGACAVPIHSATPAPRLRDIAEQCAMRHLIGSLESSEKLGSEHFRGGPLECVVLADVDAGELPDGLPRPLPLRAAEAAQSPEPLPKPTVDTDLAYVLFTSGSTGSPKGVMLSHRAVLTFVNWAANEFDVRAEDRLSNHAPLNFDLSTFDIYAAMRAGASVTVLPETAAMFPSRLADLIERGGITVWYSVPSVLNLLLVRGGLEERDLSALRLILFAGEVFPVKQLRELMLALPGPRYFNLYGPTETNVCTYYEVKEPPAADARPIPIGKACANTKTIVLDADGRPQREPGQEGILYVGGSTLTDGYYGRSAETEAAFRNNPLAEGRDERLYCTGDWVRADENGDYLFLGRRDHMVKVGGHRVELGEIEAALYAHPAIGDAAAIALPDDMLGNRVKAFVVPEAALDEQTVKRHCSSLIPRYMVPHVVEFRVSLPRTATDKVDRPKLLAESLEVSDRAG
jgi:amino acid adenylation domain-containing protein